MPPKAAVIAPKKSSTATATTSSLRSRSSSASRQSTQQQQQKPKSKPATTTQQRLVNPATAKSGAGAATKKPKITPPPPQDEGREEEKTQQQPVAATAPPPPPVVETHKLPQCRTVKFTQLIQILEEKHGASSNEEDDAMMTKVPPTATTGQNLIILDRTGDHGDAGNRAEVYLTYRAASVVDALSASEVSDANNLRVRLLHCLFGGNQLVFNLRDTRVYPFIVESFETIRKGLWQEILDGSLWKEGDGASSSSAASRHPWMALVKKGEDAEYLQQEYSYHPDKFRLVLLSTVGSVEELEAKCAVPKEHLSQFVSASRLEM